MKAKFKVGDRVRILDGSNIKNYTGGFAQGMKKYVGKVFVVKDVSCYDDHYIGYKLHNSPFTWDERGLELFDDKIVIYRKDNQVIAVDRRTGEKGISRCNPEDTFDFYIGARLAFDRLLGDKNVEDPETVKTPLNAKIVFIKGDNVIKAGHIYEIKDGMICIDSEFIPNDGKFYSMEDVKYYFSPYKDRTLPNRRYWSTDGLEFIEIKED